jgi:hypothetical protein
MVFKKEDSIPFMTELERVCEGQSGHMQMLPGRFFLLVGPEGARLFTAEDACIDFSGSFPDLQSNQPSLTVFAIDHLDEYRYRPLSRGK